MDAPEINETHQKDEQLSKHEQPNGTHINDLDDISSNRNGEFEGKKNKIKEIGSIPVEDIREGKPERTSQQQVVQDTHDDPEKSSTPGSPQTNKEKKILNESDNKVHSPPRSPLNQSQRMSLKQSGNYEKKIMFEVTEDLSVQKKEESSRKDEDITSSPKGKPKKEKKKKKEKEHTDDEGTMSEYESRPRTKSKSQRIFEHKKNVLGETIYKGHPSWALMQNIQIGIRHSVGKSAQLYREQDLQRLRQLEEFEKHEQLFKSPNVLEFPPEGTTQTQPHKTVSFKFKDYCPLVFRHLREKFQIDPADYMVSICNTLDNGQNALRELPTPGKSGSLFFFSHDMKYIIKTIPKREAKLLRFLLPAYYKHVMENTNTLLPRFFGLHRVKPKGGRQVRFVVMGNIFATYKHIHERFDIKGSKVGRSATDDEKIFFKESVTLKDNDWIENNRKLWFGPERKAMFMEQLKKDCVLLEKLNIMDYSLLVGMHYCDKGDCDCPARVRLRERELRREEKKKRKQQKQEEGYSDDSSRNNTMPHQKPIHERSLSEADTGQPQLTKIAELKSNSDVDITSPREYDTGTQKVRGHRHTPSMSSTDTERRQSMVQSYYPLPDKFQSKAVSIWNQDDGGILGTRDNKFINEFYFIGIIDILMLYSLRKRGEHAYKTLRFGKEISAVHPVEYSKRFQDFVEAMIE